MKHFVISVLKIYAVLIVLALVSILAVAIHAQESPAPDPEKELKALRAEVATLQADKKALQNTVSSIQGKMGRTIASLNACLNVEEQPK